MNPRDQTRAKGAATLFSLFAERNVRALLFSYLDLQSVGRTGCLDRQYAAAVRDNDEWSLKAVAAREFPRLVLGAKWAIIKKILTRYPQFINLMFMPFDLTIHGQKMRISPMEYACYVRDKYLLQMCDEAALTEAQREQFDCALQHYRPAALIPTHEETLAEEGYQVFMENYVEPWLEEYELCAISAEERNPKFIYIECTDAGLNYEVIGLDDELKKDIIHWEKLPENFPKELKLIMRSNGECLTAILNETALKGHTKMARGVTINSMREYLMTQTRQMSLQQKSYCLQPFYWACEAYLALSQRAWEHRLAWGQDPLLTTQKLNAFCQKIDGYAKRNILTIDKRKIMQGDGGCWGGNQTFAEPNFPLECSVRDYRKSHEVYIDPDCDDNPDDIFGENYSLARGYMSKAIVPSERSQTMSGMQADLMSFRYLDVSRRTYMIELCEQADLRAAQKLKHSP